MLSRSKFKPLKTDVKPKPPSAYFLLDFEVLDLLDSIDPDLSVTYYEIFLIGFLLPPPVGINSKLFQGFHGGRGRLESLVPSFYLEDYPEPFLFLIYLLYFSLSYILSALIIFEPKLEFLMKLFWIGFWLEWWILDNLDPISFDMIESITIC